MDHICSDIHVTDEDKSESICDCRPFCCEQMSDTDIAPNTTIRKYGHLKCGENDSSIPRIRFTTEHVKLLTIVKKPSVSKLDLTVVYGLPKELSLIDQGTLGSCTGNAAAFALAVDEIKQKNKMIFLPSRLFIYYNARKIGGTIHMDSGATVHNVVKAINKYGAPTERNWIYDPVKFAVKPPKDVYAQALKFKPCKYGALDFSADKTSADRISHIKKTLICGYPIIFGFTVYESFESDEVKKTGIMPVPKKTEKIVGGHCVVCCGFDDDRKAVLVKNSWGPKWGINGYFYMPYEIISDLEMVDDFWVIQQVSNPTDLPGWHKTDISPVAINLDAINITEGVVNTYNTTEADSDIDKKN